MIGVLSGLLFDVLLTPSQVYLGAVVTVLFRRIAQLDFKELFAVGADRGQPNKGELIEFRTEFLTRIIPVHQAFARLRPPQTIHKAAPQ